MEISIISVWKIKLRGQKEKQWSEWKHEQYYESFSTKALLPSKDN